MRIASLPLNEELRLQDLYAYDILGSERDSEFDDLLEIVAQTYACPMAAISFVDSQQQWFKSKIGLPDNVQFNARNFSFCAHAILENDVLIVKDAARDVRFCDHPMVTGGLAIRFYAGVPIVSAGGYKLGTVCIIDNRPRDLSVDEAKWLRIISRQISKLLELRLKNKLLRQKAEEQLHLEKLLLQKALEEHDAEKLSISTELHENIAQTLAATRFYLEMAEGENTVNANLLHKIRENLTLLVRQVRALSHSISPLLLKDVELEDLLIGLLDQFQKNSGITGQLIFEGSEAVSHSLALTVYRVVETQLENVRQHARATHVVINIHAFKTIYLSIKDNGIGFESPSFQKGGGLNKILSRVEALKGSVEITSSIKGGCELTVIMPGKTTGLDNLSFPPNQEQIA